MKVRKGVITAAGRGQWALPLQTLVDRDGSQGAYREATGDAAGRLQFAEQPAARDGARSSSAFCLHPSAFDA